MAVVITYVRIKHNVGIGMWQSIHLYQQNLTSEPAQYLPGFKLLFSQSVYYTHTYSRKTNIHVLITGIWQVTKSSQDGDRSSSSKCTCVHLTFPAPSWKSPRKSPKLFYCTYLMTYFWKMTWVPVPRTAEMGGKTCLKRDPSSDHLHKIDGDKQESASIGQNFSSSKAPNFETDQVTFQRWLHIRAM